MSLHGVDGPDAESSDGAATYPIGLHLKDRLCVVVGGGRVALRKVRGLLWSGARVRVIAPRVDSGLKGLADSGRVAWCARAYRSGDLEGALLAFAATNDGAVNAEVAAEAASRGVLVNAADTATRGDFDLPAVLRRGRLQVAVSTQGVSPAYARLVRDGLAEIVTEDEAGIVDYLDEVRHRVMARFRDQPEAREAFWRSLFEGEFAGLMRRGEWSRAEEIVSRCLSSP